MKRFVLEYRSLGTNYSLYLEGNNLNDVLLFFAKNYFYIEKIYEIREMESAEIISRLKYGIVNK